MATTDPAESRQTSPAPSGIVLSTVDSAPINILIVDDEPKNLTVLESLLDAPGYRLVRAESADQALLALVAEEFALLILDIRMPGMTGFELAQIIKGRKKTAQVPIIFLTAYYNEDQHILEGYGSGAVDYLHKPVNSAVLRSKVAIFAELSQSDRFLRVRCNQGRIELQRVPVALSAVLALAVESSRPQIEEFGHELVLSQPEGPIYVRADLTRLSQVFMNLITNAAKYTDKGGRIDVVVESHGDQVRVVVSDNGIGIAASQLGGVFNMFSQVESALTRSRGGLGIGLSLAKRLVEMHDGAIEATSAGLGFGSEFGVVLPAIGMPVAHANAAKASDPGAGAAAPAALRILIIDDNLDGADSLSQLLALGGHVVRTAYDGLAGLKQADAFRPDVILLDIGMPKLNGYDTCRAIRAAEWGCAITVIATTGWGDAAAKQAVVDAGFDFHFVKPLDEMLLTQTLATLRPAKGPTD